MSDVITCENSSCGGIIEPGKEYYIGYNHQKGYEEMYFCCAECLRSWVKKKLTTMIISVVLGLILMIIGFSGEFAPMAVYLVFVPYVIRQIGSKLAGLFDGGVAGEILAIAIFGLACFTFVYPIYKIIRESIYYVRTLKELESE